MTPASQFEGRLLDWYKDNFRELPWNKSKDAYKIWLSEVILQQTQVKQGLPYFNRISEAFPFLQNLAEAPLEDLLKLWEGLGYYSRARNLHKGAQFVMDNYGGKLPQSRTELLKIPGIGPYTSAAIASFAFSQKEAVVDGNVLRVMSRVFDLSDDIASLKTRKKVESLAKNMISDGNSPAFNRAMMDLGATVCKPQNPKCEVCPFEDICLAKREKTIDRRPVNLKKIQKTTRHLCYFIIPDGAGGALIQERTRSGIWKGLNQLPLLELNEPPTSLNIWNSRNWSVPLSADAIAGINLVKKVRHQLTHQTLEIYFYRVTLSESNQVILPDGLQNIIDTKAFPIALRRFLIEYCVNL